MFEIIKAICDDDFIYLENLFDKGDVQGIRESLVELSIKRVQISNKMQEFLCGKLVEYSYKNEMNCSKPPQSIINRDIEMRVQLIVKYCKYLRENYSKDDLSDMDIQFYTVLKILFEHFFFIKSRGEYRHLLVSEMTYCIAIFLKFVHPTQNEDFNMLRMIIHKGQLFKYLAVFERELQRPQPKSKWNVDNFLSLVEVVSENKDSSNLEITAIWMSMYPSFRLKKKEISFVKCKIRKNYLDTSDKKRMINVMKEFQKFERLVYTKSFVSQKKLKKTFYDLKQLYAMKRMLKCVSLLKKYTSFYDESKKKCNKFLVLKDCTIKDLYAVKRVLQIFGECLKSTKSTPNITKKLNHMIEKFTSSHLFDKTNTMRQDFSHGYSLSNLYFDIESEMTAFLGQYQFYWNEITLIVYRFYEQVVENTVKKYCGNIMNLENMDQVRSFVKFAKVNLDQNHTKFLIEENKLMISELKKLKKHIRYNALAENLKQSLIEVLEEEITDLTAKWDRNEMKMMIDLVANQSDIKDAKLMSNFYAISLQQKCKPDYFERKKDQYMRLNSALKGLFLEKHVELELMGYFLNKFNFPESTASNSLVLINELYFIDIIKYKDYSSEIVKKLELKLNDDQFKKIHNSLKQKYYHDLFNLSTKAQTIKDFCNDEKLVLDGKLLNKMINDDKKKLQKIFEDCVEILKKLLDEEKTELFYYSLEYLLLIIFEILISSGYFNDNYHFLKQICPTITGRNFRNFLAHDFVLYETLTAFEAKSILFSSAKAIANIANLSIFTKPKKGIQVVLPELATNCEQLLKHAERQDELLKSVEIWNYEAFKSAISNGSKVNFLTVDGKPFFEHVVDKNLKEFSNYYNSLVSTLSYCEDSIYHFLEKNVKLGKVSRENILDYIRKKALIFDKKLFIDLNLKLKNQLSLNDILSTPSINFEFFSDLRENFPSINWGDKESGIILSKIIRSLDVKALKAFLDLNVEVRLPEDVSCLACLLNHKEVIEILLDSPIVFENKNIEFLIAFKKNSILSKFLNRFNRNDKELQQLCLETTITSNNLDALKYFLEVRQMKSHAGLLNCAARYDRLEILKYLLEREGFVHSHTLFTITSTSVMCKSIKSLKYLINILAKGPSEHMQYLFLALSWHGYLKFMKMLKKSLIYHMEQNNDMMKSAIDSKNVKIIKFLSKHGFQVSESDLLYAIENHAKEVFYYLITLNRHFEDQILNSSLGIDCLFTCLEAKNYEMFQFFVELGVNVNALSTRKYCLLCYILTSDNIQALDIILSAINVDVNNSCSHVQRPVGESISFRVFQRMIDAGANLEPKGQLRHSSFGPYPFVFFSNPMCLKHLYDNYGFDLNDVDNNNRTILHFITKFHNNMSALRVVLSYPQINLNHKDIDGNTALHQAVISLNYEAVKLLIEHNCKIDELNRINETPFVLSFKLKNYEIGKLLAESGADVGHLILLSSFRCNEALSYLK